MNDDTNECHNARLFKPAVWLMWDGIIGLTEMGLLVLLCLWFLVYVRMTSRRGRSVPTEITRSPVHVPSSALDLDFVNSNAQRRMEGILSMTVAVHREHVVEMRHDLDMLDDEMGKMCTVIPFVCALVLCAMMQFAWIIIGCVVLWRDNDPDCQPKQLHDMMWASVLIHVILLGVK